MYFSICLGANMEMTKSLCLTPAFQVNVEVVHYLPADRLLLYDGPGCANPIPLDFDVSTPYWNIQGSTYFPLKL